MGTFHYVPLHLTEPGRKVGRFHGVDRYTTLESERLVRLPLYYGLKSQGDTRGLTLSGAFTKHNWVLTAVVLVALYVSPYVFLEEMRTSGLTTTSTPMSSGLNTGREWSNFARLRQKSPICWAACPGIVWSPNLTSSCGCSSGSSRLPLTPSTKR